MSLVFLDTVGMIALWSRSDQWHSAAKNAFQQIMTAGAELTTTSFVVLECGNAAARRPYRKDADTLWQQLEAAGRLVWPTDADWHDAWSEYRLGAGNQAGIVDCVSFVVMRRLAINDAFTNDRHFRAVGFNVLF
jgi:predicted nucleic acid-binding protein